MNFRNQDRAPLLFIAGSEDNLMPPSVNQSNAKHYRHSKSITDYKEFPGRSHYIVGQDGWGGGRLCARVGPKARDPSCGLSVAHRLFTEVPEMGFLGSPSLLT